MKRICVISGCRIPFAIAGTHYKNLMSYQLGAMAIRGLVQKTAILPHQVDAVVLGTVVHNINTSNVSREAALVASISPTTPCYTVSMACISANRAIADAYNLILNNEADIVIAGGTCSSSDVPIQFPKKMQQKLFENRKMKGLKDYAKFISQLRPSDFMPEVPAIKEFTTGKTMGEDCDRLADRFLISRQDQDAFALKSHQLAAQAAANGNLASEIVNAEVPPTFAVVSADNGIRADASIEKMQTLKSAFSPPFGTLTAANSSFLTDGAAVCLIASEEKAVQLGFKPEIYIDGFTFTAQNPEDELLLGPAYAVAKLLKSKKLQLSDIDVFEFHEAFAGQVLANLYCLNSEKFSVEKLGWNTKVGQINPDKLNNWGGSLAIGHPFGATGARLVNTAANRLRKENGKIALIASCAAGGQGHAMLLKSE